MKSASELLKLMPSNEQIADEWIETMSSKLENALIKAIKENRSTTAQVKTNAYYGFQPMSAEKYAPCQRLIQDKLQKLGYFIKFESCNDDDSTSYWLTISIKSPE